MQFGNLEIEKKSHNIYGEEILNTEQKNPVLLNKFTRESNRKLITNCVFINLNFFLNIHHMENN